MSWTWRTEQYRKLESLFVQGTPELSDVLQEPQIIPALGEQSPNLVKYILAHLKDVIDIAIGRTHPSSENEQQICVNILLIRSPIIKDAIHKSAELFNYLAFSFEKNLNYNPALQLLQSINDATSANSLQLISDPITFYKKLLKLLPCSAVHDFLVELFSRPMKAVEVWAESIEADKYLIPFLLFEEPKLRCALSILLALASIVNPKSESMKRLSSPENVSAIFDTGINSPTNEIAYGSFQLLVSICNRCDDSETGNFLNIMKFFESKTNQLCMYITSDNSFTKDKRAACELLITVIATRSEISDEISQISSFLFDRFFENPTNSFLHMVFYNIIQALSSQEGFLDFLQKTNFVNRILEIEEQRNDKMASFWGQLTAIELLLKDKVQNNEKWTQFVETILNPRDETIRKSYGGDLPKHNFLELTDSESNEMPYQCKFIDSCDLSNYANKDSSSSSSSSSSSDNHEEDELVSYSGSENEEESNNTEKNGTNSSDQTNN
ncbi:hypothetical protein TRFO_26707 [Tritrichomonas foetus]|uniref:Uncharacterized protein n=1 Tax=Tritrichomonas foetus TaxID=1144522 RepID=A0A1J4K3G1_9EUKA|nr:hypothetical protein TRFO_26707 [Tritrichomonas foetus]|eukprot:OHT05514.1 hypothetical protein TRFO_26707 [Tritrichomonas foetus]